MCVFNVGDRVRLAYKNDGFVEETFLRFDRSTPGGAIGTVVDIDYRACFDETKDIPLVLVSWDDFENGHTCNGHAAQGHGWNIWAHELQLIDEERDSEDYIPMDLRALLL